MYKECPNQQDCEGLHTFRSRFEAVIMGCGSSVPVHQAPLAHRESDLLHTSSGKVPTASVALLPDLQQDWLRNPKWTMLKDWCGWHSLDQFGFKQPTIESIVGKGNGRSILGGVERPHDYQVSC